MFAFAIRCVGIEWGLPDETRHWSRHPDEPVVFAYSQQIRPAEGRFTPGFYNYGTLYLTTLRVATDMVNAYGGGPKESDPASAYRAMGRYHLAGRIVSALAGAGMAWVVFAILAARTNRFGAVVGALTVALAPGLVVHSRFQTVDVLAVFLLVLGLHYALKLAPNEGEPSDPLRLALASGGLIGLSAGTKYTGLLGLLVLAVVCWPKRRVVPFLAALGACLLTFVASTPGMFLEAEKFWKDFRYEMAHTSTGHGLVFAGTSPGFIFHLANLGVGFGVLLSALGVVGLARASFRRHVWAVALVVFAIASYALIGRAEVKFLRYVFPILPVLAVGVGWIVGRAHQHPDPRMKFVGFLSLMGIGGFLGGGTATTMQATFLMSNPESDPRKWVTRLVEQGPVGVVSDPWFYTPDFYPESGAPRFVPFAQREADRQASAIPVVRYVPPDPGQRQDWDFRLFDTPPAFVVYSSFETEGLDRLAEMREVPDQYRAQVRAYEQFQGRLAQDYTLVVSDENNVWAVVHDLMYIRPSLWVWKRKADLKTQSSGSSTTSSTSEGPARTR